jgi:hypothetical protein
MRHRVRANLAVKFFSRADATPQELCDPKGIEFIFINADLVI